MKIGDRVVIIDRAHPWWGSAGDIVRPIQHAGLDWVVRFDNGHESAAAEAELRLV